MVQCMDNKTKNLTIKILPSNLSPGSGYSQAARNISKSLAKSSIPIVFGLKNEFLKEIGGKFSPHSKCDINLHIKPPFKIEKPVKGQYNIGYFYWETDCLPEEWGNVIKQRLDEVWVPCKITARACRNAGFKGPIEILHTPMEKSGHKDNKGAASFSATANDTYIFYSIFQWNARKGYDILFRAYCEEFDKSDNVLLVVKTMPVEIREKTDIDCDIENILTKNNIKDVPNFFVIKKKIPYEDIMSIHDVGDCFVLPHHGEGWGMPIHQAMCCENLIITTKFGGVTELLNKKNSLIINSTLTPVTPMDWNPWYKNNQKWAKPSVSHLKKLMRQAYDVGKGGYSDKRLEAKKIGTGINLESFAKDVEKILSKERFKSLTQKKQCS